MQKDQLQNGATHHSSLFFVLPSLSRRKITRIISPNPTVTVIIFILRFRLLYSAYQAYSINSINIPGTAKGSSRFSPRVRTEGGDVCSNKIVR